MDIAANRAYLRALARGVGGALLFSFPLLMTMEMWQLGFAMERGRLLILLVVSLPILLGLSYFAGFEIPSAFWTRCSTCWRRWRSASSSRRPLSPC